MTTRLGKACGVAMLAWAFVLAIASSCKPRAVEPLTKVTCILLRAVTSDGVVDEVCATAEELAPYVPEILAARAGRPEGPVVAFSLSAPVPVVRRRCLAWSVQGVDGGR